ncbi:MAG: amidohydrolase family protein, partial [Prolixibacteraceae bacterium]|nr:amidohydrolase family protein [Prolixibacteraceae bacterium]
MIIDSHHHFWNYNPVEYDWIDDNMSVIRRDFLPDDLIQEIVGAGVEGVISVQARQNKNETNWLLKLASENEFIKGVVGWFDLKSKDIEKELEQYSQNKWLKGVRHVVQGEPDPEFILGKEFNNGISVLKKYGLIYEILIFWHQLDNAIKFVDNHPNQQFMLDHIAKPDIRNNKILQWKKLLKELAKRENVSCKVSGLVTEADYQKWNADQLHPYFETVLEAFGPGRILYGS